MEDLWRVHENFHEILVNLHRNIMGISWGFVNLSFGSIVVTMVVSSFKVQLAPHDWMIFFYTLMTSRNLRNILGIAFDE